MSLIRIVDEIIVRKNDGYDVWAYKTAIYHLGWKQIEQYNEFKKIAERDGFN